MAGKSPSVLPFHRRSDEQSPQGSNSSDLNASVTLPPEILDNILEHLPGSDEGRSTLIACALVATWWVRPSQRRLFSSVSIDEGNYQRWMNGVVTPGLKAHSLGYVRSLWHCRGDFRIRYRMRDLPQDSGEYLSALHNIHSLTLYRIRVEHINEEGFRTCFSAFRETLTYLSLGTFITSFSAFVALVGYFPNIRTLQLRLFGLEPDEGPVPTLSRPLRGGVHVECAQDNSLEFYNRFAKLDQEYEELVINTAPLTAPAKTKFLQTALQISTATVKFLKLTDEFRGKQPLVTLPVITVPPLNPFGFKSKTRRRSQTFDNFGSWNWG